MKVFFSLSIITLLFLVIHLFSVSSEISNDQQPVNQKRSCDKKELKKTDTDPFIFQVSPFYI